MLPRGTYEYGIRRTLHTRRGEATRDSYRILYERAELCVHPAQAPRAHCGGDPAVRRHGSAIPPVAALSPPASPKPAPKSHN